MPFFFFDVHDGSDLQDDAGTELPSLAAAKQHALRYAGCLIGELRDEFWTLSDWQIDVRDERRSLLFSLQFSGRVSPTLAAVT